MEQKAVFITDAVKGGMCISSFVLVKYREKFLVGKMARPELWVERFLVAPQFADKYSKSGGYVIPASHLKIHEGPEEAASRIVQDMVGFSPKKFRLVDVQSHISGEGREDAHWDLCVVYETKSPKGRLDTPAWFNELKFVEPKSLSSGNFTRGHGDVLGRLKLVK